MTRKQYERLVGEIVLCLPLIIFSILVGLQMYVLLAMITFIICKFAYSPVQWFHFDRTRDCLTMFYLLFSGIGVFVFGLESISFIFKNQPMIPVILGICVSLLWAYAGDWQAGYLSNKSRLEFKCITASKERFLERGLEKGLTNEDIDFITRCYRTKTRRSEFASEFYVTEDAIKKRKKRLTQRLEAE